MVVGASRTFAIVDRKPPSFRSQGISLSFLAVLFGGRSGPLRSPLVVTGLVGLTCALALFEWARRSIRGQYFSYIFSDDVPATMWTAGPYAYIRNPFYSSYLLAIASVAVMSMNVARLLILSAMVWYFTAAARHEERKFANSPFAVDYELYRRKTGRFVPRLFAFRPR
ncbi:MAG TPA: methyltransferase [Vicinamibacterales bacterium]|jgi:protein-S-isoprenylcysteine O-methyltransferase Ste14|nr:methyltransferase [Vicinamibacterales bacterium]